MNQIAMQVILAVATTVLAFTAMMSDQINRQ